MCSVKDSSFFAIPGMFGVADHNAVGSSTTPSCNGIDFINSAYPSWLGTGSFGDASYAAANSFGGPQQFYLENNTFTNAFGTDADIPGGVGGGGRVTCRFNVFNGVTSADACTNHGTETTGRARGGRQMEAYGNSLICTNTSQGCNGFGIRGGTIVSWGNTYANSGGGQFHYYVATANERRYRSVASWFGCNGSAPWDINDGATTVGTYTITAYNAGVITVSGTPWTAGSFNFPSSLYYVVFDEVTGAFAGIASNTNNSLTISWQGVGGAAVFSSASVGHTIAVLGSTLYASGTQSASFGRGYTVASGVAVSALFHSGSGATINITAVDATGGISAATLASGGTNFSVGDRAQISQTGSDKGAAIQVLTVSGTAIATFALIGLELKDTTQSWAVNQWVVSGNPYNVLDVNSGYTYEIGPNLTNSSFTSNTLSYFTPGPDNNGNGPWGWSAGDGYAIMRASQCLDQPAYYGGPLFSGTPALPIESNAQVLSPSYEFMDNGVAPSHTAFAVDTQDSLANRNYYFANASFNGTSGTGFGAYAAKPATCTNGVGYFATDQGTWNKSGGSNPVSYSLQGQLYVCAGGTWPVASSPYYIPYTYPHPLTTTNTFISPTSFNFGSVNVGSSSTNQTFVLTNNSAVTVTGITISNSGGSPSSFPLQSTTCGGTLAANASCNIVMAFVPGTTGVVSTTLTITDSDSSSPQTAVLSGTGTSSSSPSFGLTPGFIIFANQFVGTQSGGQMLYITNPGTANLVITSVTVETGNFVILANSCVGTIAPNNGCTVNIAFAPPSTGLFNDQVTFLDNAPGNPHIANISGTGIPVPSAASPVGTVGVF